MSPSDQEDKIMGNHISEKHKAKMKERSEFVLSELKKRGIPISLKNERQIGFDHKGETCVYWPVSNWVSGPTIERGRGINRMLKQIDDEQERTGRTE